MVYTGRWAATLRGHDAAARLHQIELLLEPAGLEGVAQLAQIRLHDGHHIGVHGGGAQPLVLADDGQDLAGDREMHTGHQRADDLGGALLMRRVHKGEEVADDDSFHSLFPHLGRNPSHRLFVQRHQYVPAKIEPLGDFEPQRPPDERIVTSHVVLGQIHLQVVHVVGVLDDPLAAAQLQDVPKAFGRDHGHLRALVLDDRVDPDRRAVREEAHFAQVDACLLGWRREHRWTGLPE